MIRQTVLFAGHVQGVGFRYTTERIAKQHPITGYVQNLPDGRVKLIAEGDPDHVKQFIKHVTKTMREYISDQTTETDEATGEFDSFGLRYG